MEFSFMNGVKIFCVLIFGLLILITCSPLMGETGGWKNLPPSTLPHRDEEIVSEVREPEGEGIKSERENESHSGYSTSLKMAIDIDMSYPSIHSSAKPYTLTTPYKEIFLEGKILSENGINKIELNGQTLFTMNGLKQLLQNTLPALKIYHLNQIYPLKDGINNLDLQVEDNLDNKVSKRIQIRNIPLENILKSRRRMYLAIIPLAQKAESEIDIQRYMHNRLIESFTRQARFNLVEREKLPWLLIEKAIRTRGISQKDILQKNITSKICQMSQAEGIIFAELQKTKEGIEILGRFVNVGTGATLFSHRVFAPIRQIKSNKNFEDLNMIISGLAIKFRDSFPLCTGTITAKKGRIIQVDLGADEGLFPGMGYNIYKDKDCRELISKAVIKEMTKDSTRAGILKGEKSWGIKAGYLVITR